MQSAQPVSSVCAGSVPRYRDLQGGKADIHHSAQKNEVGTLESVQDQPETLHPVHGDTSRNISYDLLEIPEEDILTDVMRGPDQIEALAPVELGVEDMRSPVRGNGHRRVGDIKVSI